MGISDFPGFDHEYDNYADRAYVMLMDENAGTEEIYSYLVEIAFGHMGLTGTPKLRARCRTAAERLVFLRPEFLTH